MVIQGEFFQLIPVNDHSFLFDLKLLHKIGGKNPREEYKDAGYGLTLESAIKKCVQFAVCTKFETLSLKEYVEEFRKIQQDIEIMLNTNPVRERIPIK